MFYGWANLELAAVGQERPLGSSHSFFYSVRTLENDAPRSCSDGEQERMSITTRMNLKLSCWCIRGFRGPLKSLDRSYFMGWWLSRSVERPFQCLHFHLLSGSRMI